MVHPSPGAQASLDRAKRVNPDIQILYEALKSRLAHDPRTGATPTTPHHYIMVIPPHSPKINVEVVAEYEVDSNGNVMIKRLIFR